MHLYFIRHGESENNALWARSGSSNGRDVDPELTERGHRQAELMAKFVSQPWIEPNPGTYDDRGYNRFEFTHLYSSAVLRAVETATYVSKATGLPLHVWRDWHEAGGMYLENETGEPIGQAGRTRAYLQERFPDLHIGDEVGDTGWWNRPYETREERLPRARRVLADLLQKHGDSDDRVAIVSHGAFYNYVMRAVLGIPDDIRMWFVLCNTAITRFDFMEEPAVVYHNRFDFLPDALVTG